MFWLNNFGVQVQKIILKSVTTVGPDQYGGLGCLTPLSTIFQSYVAVSFIGGGNHQSVESHWQTLSYYVVSSTPCHERDSNSQL